jgi:hypothetical protein
VFDVFTGPGVPTGHKTVGMRLTINAGDRTMTIREAEAVRDRVVERFHHFSPRNDIRSRLLGGRSPGGNGQRPIRQATRGRGRNRA